MTTLKAEFRDADQAREAVIDLERRGVADADRIELVDFADATDEATRRTADTQVARSVGRRAIVGGAIGAVVGAALGAGITLVLGIDPQPAAALGAAAGGAMLVGATTGFYAVAARLPVTDGVNEAVDPGAGRSVQVILHLEGEATIESARSSLEDAGGTVRESP